MNNWNDAFDRGDRRAVARALTIADNSLPALPELLRDIYPRTGRALVIGITGSPGVGKSSLVGALLSVFRSRGMTVGVVAVDPSSAETGGAILGDRIRMQEHAHDDKVFIRSLASRGQVGGLSRSAGRVIDVMDAAGMDIILVETVGAGQSEIEVAEIAAIRLVVVQPTAGDGIQALKAGILEIADFIIVNKADLPGAGTCENELRQAINLRTGNDNCVEVLQTIATTGAGVALLGEKLLTRAKAATDPNSAVKRTRRLLIREACRQLENELMTNDGPEIDKLLSKVMKADIALEQAATEILHHGNFRQ